MTPRRAAPRVTPSAKPRSKRLGPGLAAVLAATLVALSSRTGARAADEPVFPKAEGYVTDAASVLDDAARAKLEAFLDQVQRKTGAQFAVLTVRSTAPMTPAEYKTELFRRWGIGKKGEDNGVLFLVALDEHVATFETGYGIEGTLPDGFLARAIREELTPRFQAGDYAGGITATVVRCAARVASEKGVTLEWDGRELRYDAGPRVPERSALLVAFVLFLLLGGVARFLLPRGALGRRRFGGWYGGWGGGWGGGFGGGSGGFGGGGGFGGFGGGSSGGGGGSGSW